MLKYNTRYTTSTGRQIRWNENYNEFVLAEEPLAEVCVIHESCSVRLRHWELINCVRWSPNVQWQCLLCRGSEWHGSWMFLECAPLVSCLGIKSIKNHLAMLEGTFAMCGCTVGHTISYFSNSTKALLNRGGWELHRTSHCIGTCSSQYSECFICGTAEDWDTWLTKSTYPRELTDLWKYYKPGRSQCLPWELCGLLSVLGCFWKSAHVLGLQHKDRLSI